MSLKGKCTSDIAYVIFFTLCVIITCSLVFLMAVDFFVFIGFMVGLAILFFGILYVISYGIAIAIKYICNMRRVVGNV